MLQNSIYIKQCALLLGIISAFSVVPAASGQDMQNLLLVADKTYNYEQTNIIPMTALLLTETRDSEGLFLAGLTYYDQARYAYSWAYFQRASQKGFLLARTMLAIQQGLGKGIPQDVYEARKAIEKDWDGLLALAKGGNPYAMYQVALVYCQGWLNSPKLALAEEWAARGVALGNRECILLLAKVGHSLSSGERTNLMRRAVEMGSVDALIDFGYAYANGQGLIKDSNKAFVYFFRAANEGSLEGAYSLGLYYSTWASTKNYGLSREWFRRAAEQGYGEAEYEYGALHLYGKRAPHNSALAEEYLAKAANQGINAAARTLAEAYVKGQYLPQDYVKAVHWYVLLEERGDIFGVLSLANAYEKGLGVEQDYTKAIGYYEKVIENEHAQVALGLLYAQGFGVERDLGKAYRLFTQARLLGHPKAEEYLVRLQQGKNLQTEAQPVKE